MGTVTLSHTAFLGERGLYPTQSMGILRLSQKFGFFFGGPQKRILGCSSHVSGGFNLFENSIPIGLNTEPTICRNQARKQLPPHQDEQL